MSPLGFKRVEIIPERLPTKRVSRISKEDHKRVSKDMSRIILSVYYQGTEGFLARIIRSTQDKT